MMVPSKRKQKKQRQKKEKAQFEITQLTAGEKRMVISGEGEDGKDVERMLGHMILEAHRNAGKLPGKPNFIEIKEKDKEKRKYCGANGDGVTRLEIGE